MARKLVVEVVLDQAAYSRQIRQAEAKTAGLAKGIENTGRQTTAASVAFTGLGRSVALASGGFIAFSSGTEMLRSSINAAREAQTTQRQLAAQLATVGVEFDNVKHHIEESNLELSRLSGFNVDELDQSFTTLVRSTKNVDDALRLNEIAADVARGRHIQLSAAAIALGKAYGGQTTALKRLGIQIPPTLKGMAALEYVASRFAGQAEAGATNVDKFNASLHNLEVEAGKGLIPVLDGVLQSLTGVVQGVETVNQKLRGMHLGFLTHGLKDIKGPSLLNLFGVGGGDDNKAPKPFPDIGFRGVDLTAGGAGRQGVTAEQRNRMFDAMIGRLQLRAGLLTDAAAQITAYQQIADLLKKQIAKIHDVTRQLNLKDQALEVAAQIAALVKQRQEQALENLIGGADIPLLQAQATKTLTDNLAAYELQRQLIVKAIQKYGETKDLQLKLIQNQIDVQGIRDQQRQAAKDAADQARQEKVGWMEFAFERAQATKTVADDLKTANVLLRYWQKQAATGKRTLEEAQQVFRWQQEIANLRKKGDDLQTKFRPIDTARLFQGLGLTAAQTRVLRGAVAGLGAGGTAPGTHTAAFAAAGVVVNGGVHLHGVQDVAGLEDELHKRTRARSHRRRGAG